MSVLAVVRSLPQAAPKESHCSFSRDQKPWRCHRSSTLNHFWSIKRNNNSNKTTKKGRALSAASVPPGALCAEHLLERKGNSALALSWWRALSWEGPSTCSATCVASQGYTQIHLVFSQLSKVGNYLVLWTATLEKKCVIVTLL